MYFIFTKQQIISFSPFIICVTKFLPIPTLLYLQQWEDAGDSVNLS